MNNKFTIIIPLLENILKRSKDGSIKWIKINKSTNISKLPLSHFVVNSDAFYFHSGENNKFTYYLKKYSGSNEDSSYRFIACVKDSILFLIDSEDLDNPFILEAMYDAAFNQFISEIVDEILDSINKSKP